jgi:two-component SAPR family response regulator
MKYFLLFFLLFSVFAAKPESVSYGLRFKSYNVLASERTGLYLEEGKAIDVNKELVVSFDLRYLGKSAIYGSIVRIVGNSSSLISLGFSTEGGSLTYPVLVIDNEITPIADAIRFDEWFNVSIAISNENQSITLKYKDLFKTFAMKDEWKNVKICFGKCTFANFLTEEVPDICLKNVRLTRNSRLIRNWPLDAHSDSVCYDTEKNAKAIALNPEWMIDSYRQWSNAFSLSFENENRTQYAFDSSSGVLYFVPDEKTVVTCNLFLNQWDTIPVMGGKPVSKNTNHLIYNPIDHTLVSYNLEEQLVSSFSFVSQTWSEAYLSNRLPAHWHHTSDFWREDSSVVTFGGYGYHQYKNDLVKIKPKDNRWKINRLISISPRYSSASVVVGDTLFLFGGEGNTLGKQEVVTNIKADLFAVDLKTLRVSLLWESVAEPLGLPCGNMIYNAKDSCFYVLVKENEDKVSLLQLYKNKPIMNVFSSISSARMNASYNFYTLMKPENEDKLYALFCRNYDLIGSQKESKLDIYTIAYPPIPSEISLPAVAQIPFKKTGKIIGFIVVACVLVIYILLSQKKRRKKTTENFEKKPVESIIDNADFQPTNYYDRSIKSIALLGFFNVKDAQGNEVTAQFTHILKNILIAILLNSGKNAVGIHSRIINNLIWPDKDEKSVRNNRNVSINRLNTVLEGIGNVHVYNHNSFWKIKTEAGVFCDYLAVSEFMAMPKKQILDDREQIARLLELLSFGQLLPFTNAEWLDPYKAAYSNFALDFLLGILLKEDLQSDIAFRLHVSNLIFLFDSLNEEALFVKCRLLYKQGKKSLSKAAYNSFCKEYETLLGEKYLVSFSKIIETE